jgi:hypothetical protein
MEAVEPLHIAAWIEAPIAYEHDVGWHVTHRGDEVLEADPECLRNEMSSLFSPLPDLCPPFSSHDDDDDQTSGVA